MYNSFINLGKERERETYDSSLFHFCSTRESYSHILDDDSMTDSFPSRQPYASMTNRIYARYFRLVKQKCAPPLCSFPGLLVRQTAAIRWRGGRGNRYRMVLRFHSNNNHLPLSLSLFRASANDAAMRRLASIKIRRVNIINRDGLRILPETG